MRRLLLLVLLLATTVAIAPAQPLGDSLRVPSRLAARVGLMDVRTSVPSVNPLLLQEGAQDDTPAEEAQVLLRPRQFDAFRFYGGVWALTAGDIAAMTALSNLWYTGERVDWHWYSESPGQPDDGWLDDWHTYVQQDKFGHLFVAWQLARVFGEYGKWAGLSHEQAGLFGGAVSAFFQTQIEFFDGFDPGYGASRTDMVANFVGGLIGGLQVAYPEQLSWFEAKYSYHRSPYYDPNVSDNPVIGYMGNAIKDYDGISYWLVVKPEKLLPEQQRQVWPDWLGLAVGYSGKNLAHPYSGLTEPWLKGQGLPSDHQRQFFVGPDFDLISRLPVPKALRPVRTFFSFIRVPAPALEITADGLRWHWLYF